MQIDATKIEFFFSFLVLLQLVFLHFLSSLHLQNFYSLLQFYLCFIFEGEFDVIGKVVDVVNLA